jgi:hypothetical protein
MSAKKKDKEYTFTVLNTVTVKAPDDHTALIEALEKVERDILEGKEPKLAFQTVEQ